MTCSKLCPYNTQNFAWYREMSNDLLVRVQSKLAKRKGEWRKIAAAVPGVSYSWIAKVGRGKYDSSPAYDRLKAVDGYLDSGRPKGRPLVDHSAKKVA